MEPPQPPNRQPAPATFRTPPAIGADSEATARAVFSDSTVAAALRKGDVVGFREALLDLQTRTRSQVEFEFIDHILADRDLELLQPIRSAPSMITLNGFGTKLYGRSNAHRDGSYLSTLWFVALFIPIFPIARYRIRDAGYNTYSFIGKVPLTSGNKLWGLIFGLGVVSVILGGVLFGKGVPTRRNSNPHPSPGPSVAAAPSTSPRYTIVLANGLDDAIQCRIGTEPPIRIESRRHVAVFHDRGPLAFTALDLNERVLDTATVPDSPEHSVIVFNPLGATPLLLREIIYLPDSGSTASHEPKVQVLCGMKQRTAALPPIDFMFVDPVERLRTGSGEQSKWQLQTLGEHSWQDSLYMVAHTPGEFGELEAFGAALLKAHPRSMEMMHEISRAMHRVDPKRHLDFLRSVIANDPNWVEPHRMFQGEVGRTDIEAVRKEYAERYAASKSTPKAGRDGYLLARILPRAQAVPLYLELIKRFPTEPYLRLGYGAVAMNARQFDVAVTQFKALQTLDSEVFNYAFSYYIESLVGAGEIGHAIQLVAERLESPTWTSERQLLAYTYAQLYELNGRNGPRPADDFLGRQNDGSIDEAARRELMLRLGRSQPRNTDQMVASGMSAEEIATAKIKWARADLLIQGPWSTELDATLAAVEASDTSDLRSIDAVAVLLLAGEFFRRGKPDPGQRLLNQIDSFASDDVASMTRVATTGQWDEGILELPLALQAAARFIVARRITPSNPEYHRWIAEARRDDILGGLVTHAIRNWPAPR